MTAAGIAAGTGWLRHSPPAGRALAKQQRQDDLRSAARVVEMAARAAAEPHAAAEHPPASIDAAKPEPVSAGQKNGDLHWTVNTPAQADAKPDGTVLCGGKVCTAGQFCCGPPECGHCANRLTGPRCPATCP